jgi:hypothetical protein
MRYLFDLERPTSQVTHRCQEAADRDGRAKPQPVRQRVASQERANPQAANRRHARARFAKPDHERLLDARQPRAGLQLGRPPAENRPPAKRLQVARQPSAKQRHGRKLRGKARGGAGVEPRTARRYRRPLNQARTSSGRRTCYGRGPSPRSSDSRAIDAPADCDVVYVTSVV